MSTKLKLVYFDIRGRAEITRLCLYQAGVDFEDKRIEFSEWPEYKPLTPFGTLPYIEIDGKRYGESNCIARYVARKHGLTGKDELEYLQCDAVLSLVDELQEKAVRLKFDKVCNEEQKAELKRRFVEEHLPGLLGKLEKLLTDNTSGFLVGAGVTLADFAVYHITELPLKENPNLLDNYPKVAGLRKTVEALPNIKAYLAQRKDTPM